MAGTRTSWPDSDVGLGRASLSSSTSLRLVGAVALLLVLLMSSSAQGANKVVQGEFCNTVGVAGGQCRFPSGVAVNRGGAGGVTAGDVYVADRGNSRVQEFTPEGVFVRAFGADVVLSGPDNTVGGTAEVCVAGSDVCQAGTNSSSIAGAVSAPEAIVIDQANGNVYVAGEGALEGNQRVDVFSATGVFEGAFGWKVNASTPDAKLQLCTVVTGCQRGERTGLAGGLSDLTKPALAVDPSNGHLYVGERGNARVNEFIPALNGAKEVTGVSFARAFGGDVISGGAKGTGKLVAGSKSVSEVIPTEKKFIVGQEVSASNGGVPPGTTIADRSVICVPNCVMSLTLSSAATVGGTGVTLTAAASPGNVPRNEKQTISVSATGGNFQLIFASEPWVLPTSPGSTRTGNISFNASPGEVETALKNLANVGAGNVAVTGSPGNYTVEFKGSRFADTNVSQLVLATGSPNLTGGSATVTTTVEGTSAEVCTSATSCQAGTPSPEAGRFVENTPTGLAVDSGGFIYAATSAGTCSTANPCRVEKFNPDGSFKEAFGPSSGGTVACQLSWTNNAAANLEAANGVAVDPANQHVFVTRKFEPGRFEVCEFDSGGVLKDRSPGSPGLASDETGYLSPALSATEHVYVNAPINGAQGAVYILGPAPPAPEAEMLPPTEIGATSAHLNGRVTIPAPGGPGFSTTYHFEYSGDHGDHWTSVPVPDESIGSAAGPVEVHQEVSGLQPNLTYRVRLVGCTGKCTTSAELTPPLQTLPEEPTVANTIALPVTGSTAKLNGTVNPNNSATTYHFEWGSAAEFEKGKYGHQLPDFDAFVGDGGQPVAVSASITGLQLSSTYHFRIVAVNSTGTTVGADASFTTNNFPTSCAGEAIREQQGSTALPDCRAYEQVSANDKRPVGQVSLLVPNQLSWQAAADGNGMYYSVLGGLSDATAGGEIKYLAGRESLGWQSQQASAPALIPFPGGGGHTRELTSKTYFNSPDLSCGFLESFEPLTADTPIEDVEQGVFNLYRRNADGTYTLVSKPVPLNPGGSAEFAVDGAASDCSHVLFHTGYRLLSEAPVSGQNLYEWANGTLRIAAVLPDGNIAGGVEAGNPKSSFNSMSNDGSKVFFHAVSDAGGDTGGDALFVRKSGTSTVDISQSRTAIINNSNTSHTTYQMATPNGTHVYFTAKYGLATNGHSSGSSNCVGVPSGEGCDLYDYNVESNTLKDLTVDDNPLDKKGASVVSLVDASDDGSYVYFSARGQLVPGFGKSEVQNLTGDGSLNLYLNHNGTVSFVAVLTTADGSNGGTNTDVNAASRFENWAADATADGHYLLFTSRANVTGYDSGGAVEAYRYSADADSVVCVSCRADGQPSLAGSSFEGGPIANKLIVTGRDQTQYQYRPRSISEDGSRIFFTMPDVLAPGAIPNRNNVYEWEKGQVSLLAAGERIGAVELTKYLDSSASGDDVFLVNRAKLAAQDFDSTLDVYDARVDGGFPYAPPVDPCDPLADECQHPAPAPPPADGTLPSGKFVGPGNPPAPKPTSRGGHGHKKHHRTHRRHQRREAGNQRRTAR